MRHAERPCRDRRLVERRARADSPTLLRDGDYPFVGSGDAFGSGGRFQACISLRGQHAHVLLDCGIPFLVLNQQFAQRERPLLVAGPPGLRDRVTQAMEVRFPGSSQTQRRFELHLLELPERTPTPVGPAEITGMPAAHPLTGLRVRAANRRSADVLEHQADLEIEEVIRRVPREAEATARGGKQDCTLGRGCVV